MQHLGNHSSIESSESKILRGQVNKFLENLSEGIRSVMLHYFLTSSMS